MLAAEPTLIASTQAGNLDDFDPLYQEYVKPIYGFIYRRTLVREIAEDLTSITFLKALEKIKSYDSTRGSFPGWLYRIARNVVNDHYRALRPTVDIEDVWDLSSDDDTTTSIQDRLAFEKLKPALDKLDADKRRILLLRLWDGLSYKEIAEITGKSEGNCKVIVCRTLEQLRAELPLMTFLLLLLSPFSPL